MVKGDPRDVYCLFLTDASGQKNTQNPSGARTIMCSLWHTAGAPLQNAPPVRGAVVLVRGFTGVTPTGSFNRWHEVELVGTMDGIIIVDQPEDQALPLVKALNPLRTLYQRNPQPLTSQGPAMSLLASPTTLTPTTRFCSLCGSCLLTGMEFCSVDGHKHR